MRLARAEPRATTFTVFTWNADAPEQVVIELFRTEFGRSCSYNCGLGLFLNYAHCLHGDLRPSFATRGNNVDFSAISLLSHVGVRPA
jgi:hypothetical protein